MSDTPFVSPAAKLDALKQAAWLPPELTVLAKRVHAAQGRAAAPFEAGGPFAVLPPCPPRATGERHRRGDPLLPRAHFSFDVGQAQILLRNLQGILSRLGGPFREASQRFGALKSKGRLRAGELFRAHVNEDADWFADQEREFVRVPGLPRFLAQSSVSPFAHARTRDIARNGGHDPASIWTYGHCPHCGSQPVIGELRGTEGMRMHVCSFCLLVYRAKRLQCPFCLEENPDKLAFFTADTEPGYQAHVCRSCNRYIKLADSRQKSAAAFVPALDDLLSLPLDMLAAKEGFQRPTASVWGF